MTRILMFVAAGGLLVTLAPRVSAVINYNASKSNTATVSYPVGVLTPSDVLRITKMIDKADPGSLNEAAVRQFLMQVNGKTQGGIKSIIVEHAPAGKSNTILLLADPKDEAQARQALPGKMKSGQ